MRKYLLLVLAVPLVVSGVSFATEKPKEEKPPKEEHRVVICHKTKSVKNPWVTIEVDKHSLKKHLKHGDYKGECKPKEPPKEEPPVVPPVETPKVPEPTVVAPTPESEPVFNESEFGGK